MGAMVTFECQASGGGNDMQLNWYFNDKLLPNTEVEVKEDAHGATVLFSQFTIDVVKSSDVGYYLCKVDSPLLNQTVRAPIQLRVASKLFSTY